MKTAFPLALASVVGVLACSSNNSHATGGATSSTSSSSASSSSTRIASSSHTASSSTPSGTASRSSSSTSGSSGATSGSSGATSASMSTSLSSSTNSSTSSGGGTDGGGIGNPNPIGINMDAPQDYSGVKLYANAMQVARLPYTLPGSSTPVSVDGNGWPTADFEILVSNGLPDSNGTYALSFLGQASSVQVGGGTLSGLAYDSATNTTTATVTVAASDSSASLILTMTGTRRTAQSATGSGVTDIVLMRPTSPGATSSISTGTRFNPEFIAVAQMFTTIRYMDFLATNWNQQANWSDRQLLGNASYNFTPAAWIDAGYGGWQGLGGPWEDVAQVANATNTNAWINLPVSATDTYITDVAQLLKCGSDGVNPWIGADGVTCKAGTPAYPPLNSNLKLYIEFSNEVWNGGFAQSDTNHAAAMAEVSAYPGGVGPLNFDGTTNDWSWAWRRVAERGVTISTIFRTVFGDAAMMTQVRPVLETQQGDGQATLGNDAQILLGYYANLWGIGSSSPHPPSYYFYGGGGSSYYNPDDSATSTITIDTIWTSETMDAGTWGASALVPDINLVTALGLRRTAYEGGPSLDTSGNATVDAVKAAAVLDPRMTTALEQHQTAWVSYGGDEECFFTMVDDYQWGFANGDISAKGTPKLAAIAQMDATPAPYAALIYGPAVPVTLDGAAYVTDNADSAGAGTGTQGYALTGDGWSTLLWGAYLVRTVDTNARSILLSIASASGSVSVLLDGVSLGTQTAANGTMTWSAGTLSPGLHGVVVAAPSGSFTLTTLAVQ